MRKTFWLLGVAVLFPFVGAAIAGDASGVDAEGFIQKWLVLAPIPFADGEGGGDALNKEQIKDEAKLKPKAGTKVKIRDKELAWKEHVSKEHLVDFNKLLGGVTEDSVAYAVTYIVVPEELKNVKMLTGSDDQCKVYLNGKEVFKNPDPRAADKDQDATEVVLRKGVNVLVAKVINETYLWSFCVRFIDKDGKSLKNLKSQTTQ